ncbi:hypothetical protein ACHAPI_010939 [Fusarium lateritium]
MPNLSPPLTPDKIAIPEPYTGSSQAVCKQLRHIHKACGQWPWEFLPGRLPEVLDKDVLGPLVIAVQLVSDDGYGVTLSELIERLTGQKTNWVLTSENSADALDWVIYTHDKRARRRRTANNENESGRKSSRARKRQHSNNEETHEPHPHPPQEPRQKKYGAGSTSSTVNNEAGNKAQSEAVPNPQPEFESKSESESEYVPQYQPEPELDHSMEMDVDDTNPNGNNDENIKANVSLNATNLERIEEAMAASACRLRVARDNLKVYEDDLGVEREELTAINTSLSKASEDHEAAIRMWRDAVVKADTKQNEVKQFHALAQSFSHDTQAALEQHGQILRLLHDQALEVEKHAKDELRTRRREFCVWEEKKDAKEGTTKKISARIRRYQDDIDSEEVKHQRLLAEHYLELLSNDIIQGISIADISYARILEIKLEREQRIWYEQRQG